MINFCDFCDNTEPKLGDVCDECLLNAIDKYPYSSNLGVYDYLFEKTTNFDGCLYEALRYQSSEHLLHERLFEKTDYFLGCLLLALESEHVHWSIVHKLCDVTSDFEGCLKLAIQNYDKIQKTDFLTIMNNTTDFSYCLLAAINVMSMDEDTLFSLVDHTDDFEHALYATLFYGKRSRKFVDFLVENTTDFGGCLNQAIKNVSVYGMDLVHILFDKTTKDFDGCLYEAILNINDEDFLCKLLEKTCKGERLECYNLALKKVPEMKVFLSKF